MRQKIYLTLSLVLSVGFSDLIPSVLEFACYDAIHTFNLHQIAADPLSSPLCEGGAQVWQTAIAALAALTTLCQKQRKQARALPPSVLKFATHVLHTAVHTKANTRAFSLRPAVTATFQFIKRLLTCEVSSHIHTESGCMTTGADTHNLQSH